MPVAQDILKAAIKAIAATGTYCEDPEGIALAALEAAERARWQPIETAPKDEDANILLGCFGEHWHGGQFVAFWDDSSDDKDRHWQTADGPAYHDRLPTHWQPLPWPPESK